MRALVTGAAGFIGSHLVEILIERGFELICLVKRSEDTRWIEGMNIQIVFGDVTDSRSLVSIPEGQFDYVFHLAGVMKTDSPSDYYRVNREGTRNLVELCIERKIPRRRFIYMSSVAASGPSGKQGKLKESDECRPVNDYGKSKLEAEKVLIDKGERVPFTILRPSLVYGPRNSQGVFTYFQCVAKGIKPDLGEGMSSVIYVKDLVKAVLLAADRQESRGQIYFVGDKRIFSYREISDTISEVMGKKALRVKIPTLFLLFSGAVFQAAAKVTNTRPAFDLRRARDLKHRYWTYDTSKIYREIGFKPQYTLREGVGETIKWYRDAGWI